MRCRPPIIHEQRGQDLIEYTVLMALIAAAVVLGAFAMPVLIGIVADFFASGSIQG
jgi:Flp pilus assembly pilin Flp